MKILDKSKVERNIKEELNKHDVILVLKDNAYGFGLTKVYKIAYNCGVKRFSVHTIQEAIILRKQSQDIEILLLGPPSKNIKLLKEYEITVSINNFEEFLFYEQNDVKMHIKIDMGMNRFGFKEVYQDILESKNVTGIYMHTYTENNRVNNHLVKQFLIKVGKTNKLVHIGGSSILGLNLNCCVRFGIGIYKDAVYLYGRIISIKKVKKGEGVGYENLFMASEDTYIGVCNIGYANGLSRDGKNTAYVFIQNKKYKIVGNRCMDVCFIVIDETIEVGDIVEFCGENIKLPLFAKLNSKTSHEILLQMK